MNLIQTFKNHLLDLYDEGYSGEEALEIAESALEDYVDMKIDEMKEREMWGEK